jgi:hypothetical protein
MKALRERDGDIEDNQIVEKKSKKKLKQAN